jgi:hypothetical protein
MPSSQLKRAERAMQTIRDRAELPPETADALQEIVDVIRTIEGRFVDAGRQKTPAPLRVNGTAKWEMTMDHVVLPLAASIWTSLHSPLRAPTWCSLTAWNKPAL